MMAKKIAVGESWEFWQIGDDVYRSAVGTGMDIYGHPMAKRWECSRSQWDHFRAVFGWANDV